MNSVYEPNSPATRFLLTAEFEQFLSSVSAKGGFQVTTDDPKGYQVMCDDKNNTPASIDRQEMIVWMFVKPIRVAKFIPFQVVITPTGVSFSELVNRGVVF
jgi:phage tail sheath protein FI